MPDVRLFRNAQGKRQIDGRWFKWGLGDGTSDLVGWLALQAPSGLKVARFLAIEVKVPGKENAHPERVEEQRRWLELVKRDGGVAGFVTSVEEAVLLVEEGRVWL